MERRRFLLAGGPAIAVMTLAASGCSRGTPQKEIPYSPTFFRPVEWAFINTAVARLIPAEGAGPGTLEAGVPEFIDRQMELPYGHGAYLYLKGPFLTNTPPSRSRHS